MTDNYEFEDEFGKTGSKTPKSKVFAFHLGEAYADNVVASAGTNASDYIRKAIAEFIEVFDSLTPEHRRATIGKRHEREKTRILSVRISDEKIADFLDTIPSSSEFIRMAVESKIDLDEMQEHHTGIFDPKYSLKDESGQDKDKQT